MVPVRESHIDVLVAGGGTAGVCAAISAAMCGAQVRVIEQNGFLAEPWSPESWEDSVGFLSGDYPIGNRI